MHLLYVLLILGGALAHYRGPYDSRNLVERDEPDTDGVELVECPVCENGSSWIASNEECPLIRDGKRYKRCLHGTYINNACGNKRDCYRGPEEKCTEKMTIDLYDQRCVQGYYCHPVERKCIGLEYSVDSNKLWFLSPNSRYPDRRASNLQYPIRARRHA